MSTCACPFARLRPDRPGPGHYDGTPLVTRQQVCTELLIESAGPYRVGFRLSAEPAGLRFRFARAWFGPLPLPGLVALRVDADASAGPHIESWRVDVRITVPLLGLLARYIGEVTPSWTKP